MEGKVTLPALQRMKREGRKIVGVVAYDYQTAQIVDRAGVDIVSVGDSVGMNLWGQRSELDVTLDQMMLAAQGVRRGVERALVSCDFPFGPLQEGPEVAVRAAIRLVKEGGVDLVKLDGASAFPDAVRAIARAGIPVWAQFGITPHTALQYGGMSKAGPELATAMKAQLLVEAKLLEDAGAALLDFTNSGPVAGAEVTRAIGIPVIGGLGGGPWLDGRVRSVFAAIGYLASALDDEVERYANVAKITFDAITTFADDVRASRQIRGATPAKAKSA
jgi:3-methyl-2-oxobutanoate hydroxymethyltransferase